MGELRSPKRIFTMVVYTKKWFIYYDYCVILFLNEEGVWGNCVPPKRIFTMVVYTKKGLYIMTTASF